MAAQNLAKNIITRIQTQLQEITTDDGYYNNDVADTNIKRYFVSYQECGRYPFICIASIRVGETSASPRGAFECPFSVEIFGYTDNRTDPLLEAVEMAEDIEQALYHDEDLNDQVKEPSASFECGNQDNVGVCHFTYSGVYVWTDPIS